MAVSCMMIRMCRYVFLAAIFAASWSATSFAQTVQMPVAERPPTRADILRGEYGRYRANNDVLFYRLDIRVDPEKTFIAGTTTIRFRMLTDDTRIQIDLYSNLNVDRI